MEFGKKHMPDDPLVQTVWTIYSEARSADFQSIAKIKNPGPMWTHIAAPSWCIGGMVEYEFYTVLWRLPAPWAYWPVIAGTGPLGLPIERSKSVTTEPVKRLQGKRNLG